MLIRTIVAGFGLAFLGGCAQQDVNLSGRQARVDSFCQGWNDTSADALTKCEQYYARNTNIEPPNMNGYPRPSPVAASAVATPPQPSPHPIADATYQSEPPASQQTGPHSEVSFRQRGGTFVVPVIVNNAIRLNFTLDTGAADVSIPADVVMTLMRTGTISDNDFLGKQTYVLADGSEVPSLAFRIRSLRVGDKVVENVTGSVAPSSGSLLLGQSFLKHFRSWSIDNQRMVLVLE